MVYNAVCGLQCSMWLTVQYEVYSVSNMWFTMQYTVYSAVYDSQCSMRFTVQAVCGSQPSIWLTVQYEVYSAVCGLKAIL